MPLFEVNYCSLFGDIDYCQSDQTTYSVAYNLLAYHAQIDTPRMRPPLMTALALLTSEWEQDSLFLMRKYACVKVFSFISQITNLIIAPRLQLKFMNQQNKVVEIILNRIISKSRKNSGESLDCRAVSQKCYQSNQPQFNGEEYIIKKSDLKSFVQKMALENYQNRMKLEEKQQQFVQLQQQVHRGISQIEHLKQALENRDIAFKKKAQEMQGKLSKQKKKREQMQLQLSWSTNKIKEQLRQIQKLKQSFIAKVQHKPQSNNTPANQSQNKQSKQYNTPGKDNSKRLEQLATKNCQSIEYSVLHLDTVNRRPQNNPKEFNTSNPRDSKAQSNNIFNPIQNIQVKSKQTLNTNVQMSRFHRHAQIDQKDRIIKQLAQKCIFLQSHIQKLTKKYLGEFVYAEDTQSREPKRESSSMREQLKTIEQPSYSSLERTESQVQLSSAFKVQAQL